MKFIISKTSLEMAVKNICRVINPKNALPILADILCMVDEERKTINPVDPLYQGEEITMLLMPMLVNED